MASLTAVTPARALDIETDYTPNPLEQALEEGVFTPLYEASTAVRLLANFGVSSIPRRYQVAVANCGNNISQVKLRVLAADVRVQSVGVLFADRTSRQFTLNRTFNSGYESPWISLSMFRPVGRCATAVFVNANSLSRQPARVQVFGDLTR